MSWEESKPELHPCPCNKGHYSVTHRSDDWGRSEERWAMLCSACKANYELHTYYGNRKGITETYYGWLPKSLARELATLGKQIEKAKEKIAIYFRSQYGEKWHRHFSGKTKKAIWFELTENGKSYPSLSTFYSHIRNSGLARVLGEYLGYRETNTVIRILKIKDAALSSMIKKVQELEKTTGQEEQHARQKAFA